MTEKTRHELVPRIAGGDVRALARALTFIENRSKDYESILLGIEASNTAVVGITGAPGSGKSTLVDLLIGYWRDQSLRVAVLCVDPSSPFNHGALLGDRIRMSRWYEDEHVFIRSLATRGSLGGLHPSILEITDCLRAAPFDRIIVETVGVGQTEVEIAGLADVTVVILVPEGGDEVQTMKAGVMEIADIFVVNKCDRPGADQFVRNLQQLLMPGRSGHHAPIVKTSATAGEGIESFGATIDTALGQAGANPKQLELLADKLYRLIQERRMKDVDRRTLRETLATKWQEEGFNLYRYARENY